MTCLVFFFKKMMTNFFSRGGLIFGWQRCYFGLFLAQLSSGVISGFVWKFRSGKPIFLKFVMMIANSFLSIKGWKNTSHKTLWVSFLQIGICLVIVGEGWHYCKCLFLDIFFLAKNWVRSSFPYQSLWRPRTLGLLKFHIPSLFSS